MIKDYQVIFAEDLSELEGMIKKEIAAGWQPIGGIAMADSMHFAQAMVKYEPILQSTK